MKGFGRILAAFLLALPVLASADVTSDIHIGSDGVFTAKNVTVMQKASSTFFVRGTWGTTFLRLSVLTNSSTAFSKDHGEISTLADVKEGDVIDVEGSLVVSTESFSVNATKIRDHALQSGDKTLVGYISALNATSTSFSLVNASFGTTLVQIDSSTIIKKGTDTAAFSDIAKGDKVLGATGTYDYTSNTLSASNITIYQPKEIFVTKNFQGTLKSVAAAVLPTSLVVTIEGKDYTVHLTEKTSVLNNKKAKSSLVRFAPGDTIRIYGTVGDRNPLDMSAEVVRDTSF